MKHKKLFITFTVIFSVLLALIIFIMIWFWGDRYDDFDDFRSEVAISGLKDGACPQGITVYKADKITLTDEDGNKEELPKQNYFFISAYFKNSASRIYVVGEVSGEIGYATLKNIDGSDHTGHVGGIATNGHYLWVSSGKTIYVAKNGTTNTNNVAIDLIKAAKENGSLKFTTSFKANCNAAFLYYYDADDRAPTYPDASDYLYVGEFYRSGNYETNEIHHLATPNGETNRAFAYEYRVTSSSTAAYGLAPQTGITDSNDNEVPKIQKIFSIPNEVQGFARTDKGLVLSVSYGLKNSHIYYHGFNWGTLTENDTRIKYTEIAKGTDKNKLYEQGFEYDGAKHASNAPYYDNSVYVYYIDDSTMLNDYSIPSMSEGLCTTDGRVYVLFESGAKKYSTFVRQVLNNVYSFIPRKK
ncbi:MAG: hypothetical protein K2K38_01245 [Clostridia bacterium]|nr:hypothetical protein [Clostridia bacterium]